MKRPAHAIQKAETTTPSALLATTTRTAVMGFAPPSAEAPIAFLPVKPTMTASLDTNASTYRVPASDVCPEVIPVNSPVSRMVVQAVRPVISQAANASLSWTCVIAVKKMTNVAWVPDV